MEPVTHFMTGVVLARAGFNRKSAYAVLAMTLAAEAPDLDVLWSLRGPVAGLEHHRGWTHTLLGLPFEAFVVLAAVWLWHAWRTRLSRLDRRPAWEIPDRRTAAPPVRWSLLYGFILVALLSHILLDWTNNYGVRPFFPFDPHWYAGSFIFIFEPVLFGLLLLALVAPALFGLIGSEIGARRERFRGRGWAIGALIGVLLLWGARWFEKGMATRLAFSGDYGGAEIQRISVSPYPLNPFQWHAVVETPNFFQVSTVDTLRETVATSEQVDVFYKPPTTLSTLAAKRSWLGEIYLDWSQWPLITEVGTDATQPQNPVTEVTFRDLRFMYDTLFLHGREDPPISGAVYVDDDRRIVRMELNGSPQH